MAAFFAIFAAVFLAELGDKTQLAALMLSSDSGGANKWVVFAASSCALVASTGLAVLAGSFAGKLITGVPLKLIGGLGFLAMGGWMILEHFQARPV